jgi:membrane protease YdiL (CAAX protease family)
MLQGHSPYTGWNRSADSLLTAMLREAFYVALGEEMFFRGLLGGWLMRKLGFALGNLVQAAIFLLPHLLLLQLGTAIWPVFIVQFVAGWLQGWLRYRSASILPGWLVHTLSNTSSAFSAMM